MQNALSPILGTATQLGFVVRDLEAAMRHWIDVFGVGPFICMEKGTSQPAATTYLRGKPVVVELKLAFGFMGDVQIELIQQRNDAPSPYTEFLGEGREGLQHFGFSADNHAKAVKQVVAAGYERVYEIGLAGQDDPIIYFSSPKLYGPMLEIVPAKWRKAREAVRKACDEWTGGDPIIRYETYVEFLQAKNVVFD